MAGGLPQPAALKGNIIRSPRHQTPQTCCVWARHRGSARRFARFHVRMVRGCAARQRTRLRNHQTECSNLSIQIVNYKFQPVACIAYRSVTRRSKESLCESALNSDHSNVESCNAEPIPDLLPRMKPTILIHTTQLLTRRI